MNDPQIIITGLSNEQYKLGSSDYKGYVFSLYYIHLIRITIWLERRSACKYLHPRNSHNKQIREESIEK